MWTEAKDASRHRAVPRRCPRRRMTCRTQPAVLGDEPDGRRRRGARRPAGSGRAAEGRAQTPALVYFRGRIWVVFFYFSSLRFSVLFEFLEEQCACIIFIIREKKSCFHFVKVKKGFRITASDPAPSPTSCQKGCSGSCVYLESEKNNHSCTIL